VKGQTGLLPLSAIRIAYAKRDDRPDRAPCASVALSDDAADHDASRKRADERHRPKNGPIHCRAPFRETQNDAPNRPTRTNRNPPTLRVSTNDRFGRSSRDVDTHAPIPKTGIANGIATSA
jgi:hypothetical protein